MDDVAGGERSAGLVRHGVDNSQQGVRERHTRQALAIVHLFTASHVAVEGLNEIAVHNIDRLQSQRIGEHGVQGGHIGLNRVGQCVHTGVSHQLGRHGLGQGRIDDGHVRGDVEVCQRVLDALFIIGDDGEGGHFRSGAGGGGDGAELGLLAQLREIEGGNEILERGLGILIERPHRLGCVDGGTAAHGDDPIGLELAHYGGAVHNGLHGGIGLHVLDELGLNAGFLQISQGLVHKAKALHGAAAQNEDSLLSFQVLEVFQRIGAVINIAGKGKSGHDKYLQICRIKSILINL